MDATDKGAIRKTVGLKDVSIQCPGLKAELRILVYHSVGTPGYSLAFPLEAALNRRVAKQAAAPLYRHPTCQLKALWGPRCRRLFRYCGFRF
jgi:hypothetical protein